MDNAIIVESLRVAAGPENLLTGDVDRQTYGLDWTRFHQPDPLAVVMARDIEQVIRLVAWANEHGIALVPSGGRTGHSGGAVAANREVVVSFEKMNRILDYDPVDGLVTVEPGVVTATLQQFARDHDREYPVDFASAGSSQIGGNIATNAGGIKVLRYGLTRDRVAGLKVVTGRGELLDLNRGLVKNATGYDFRHLFIGSEGTLGLIVEATVSLTSPPGPLAALLLSVPDMPRVMEVLARFRDAVSLTAFEFLSDNALACVMARHGLRQPVGERAGYYALVEYEQTDPDAAERALAAFSQCVESGLAADGVASQSEQDRRALWKYREFISESIAPQTPYKNDLSVRVSQVPEFLDAVERTVIARYPTFEIVWFGHIGDGNLHLNVLKPDGMGLEDFKRRCETVSDEILSIVGHYGGSVSAEHGVGLLKRDQLHFSRSPAEIEMMRGVKQLFDPNGIMNPGKLLPAER